MPTAFEEVMKVCEAINNKGGRVGFRSGQAAPLEPDPLPYGLRRPGVPQPARRLAAHPRHARSRQRGDFLAYRWLGLLDTKLGLILIYLTFNISLVVWLMRSFFDACPRSLEEAAWVDGASLWQGFVSIMLPISGPGVAATAILCFLYSWNDFFFALILTRNHAMTAPVAVVNFMNYKGWEWGKIAAGGAMVMLPVLVFSIVVRKFLIQR
jgi:ABC-type sulfate transport system permease component